MLAAGGNRGAAAVSRPRQVKAAKPSSARPRLLFFRRPGCLCQWAPRALQRLRLAGVVSVSVRVSVRVLVCVCVGVCRWLVRLGQAGAEPRCKGVCIYINDNINSSLSLSLSLSLSGPRPPWSCPSTRSREITRQRTIQMMRYYTYLNVKYGYVNNHGSNAPPLIRNSLPSGKGAATGLTFQSTILYLVLTRCRVVPRPCVEG